MNKIYEVFSEVEKVNSLNNRDHWMNSIHPVVKIFLVIVYIACVMSCKANEIESLILMVIYPIFVFIYGEISFMQCLSRIKVVFPLIIIVGIFNPILDREIVFNIAGMSITNGMLTMMMLIWKGFLSLIVSYILVATTSIEEICYALKLVHVPTKIVTVVLLIYRYIFMLIQEIERVTIAYKLRAPFHKGIKYSSWGPLVGQILIRSMDRATTIYDAMQIRGFLGEYHVSKVKYNRVNSIGYFIFGFFIILIPRLYSQIR